MTTLPPELKNTASLNYFIVLISDTSMSPYLSSGLIVFRQDFTPLLSDSNYLAQFFIIL